MADCASGTRAYACAWGCTRVSVLSSSIVESSPPVLIKAAVRGWPAEGPADYNW